MKYLDALPCRVVVQPVVNVVLEGLCQVGHELGAGGDAVAVKVGMVWFHRRKLHPLGLQLLTDILDIFSFFSSGVSREGEGGREREGRGRGKEEEGGGGKEEEGGMRREGMDSDVASSNCAPRKAAYICLVQTLKIRPAQLSCLGGSAGRVVCLERRTSRVRVPPEAALLFLLEKKNKKSCLWASLLAFALSL